MTNSAGTGMGFSPAHLKVSIARGMCEALVTRRNSPEVPKRFLYSCASSHVVAGSVIIRVSFGLIPKDTAAKAMVSAIDVCPDCEYPERMSFEPGARR